MIVWIDIEGAQSAERLFRLDPVLRHLRALASLSPRPSRVILSGGGGPGPDVAGLSIERSVEEGPTGARLRRFLTDCAEDVVVLDGASAVDPRLLAFLLKPGPARSAFGGEDRERTAVLRVHSNQASLVPAEARSVLEVASHLDATAAAPAVSADEMPSFIAKLRRSTPFWLFAVPDIASRRSRERWMFWSNYKGSTDFLTRWVYPPIVWPLVRLCTRFGIHPNAITAVSVALAFLCVPLFAAGAFLPALAMAYAMTVLDSVDGKVARVTLTSSRIGDIMDHGADIVHPPFWYLAWAWGLGARDLSDPLLQATWWLVAIYVADRFVLSAAKKRFGRGLHAVTALDGAVRTWIARRNVNLVIFTLALVLGQGRAGLYAVALWQGLTLVWHTYRTFTLPREAVAASPA